MAESDENIAQQKINELTALRERAKKDFSEQEIDNFIQMGRKLAGKAVLFGLSEVVKEGPGKGKDPVEADKLIKKISDVVPYNYVGYIQCTFEEIPWQLNICLSLVDKDYVTNIDIPHADYAGELYGKYEFLRAVAAAYWTQFAEDHAELFKRICAYRDDIDLTKLTPDPKNPTTLYLDPDCKKRVGIFCYYVDEAGKPFYKRGVKTN